MQHTLHHPLLDNTKHTAHGTHGENDNDDDVLVIEDPEQIYRRFSSEEEDELANEGANKSLIFGLDSVFANNADDQGEKEPSNPGFLHSTLFEPDLKARADLLPSVEYEIQWLKFLARLSLSCFILPLYIFSNPRRRTQIHT